MTCCCLYTTGSQHSTASQHCHSKKIKFPEIHFQLFSQIVEMKYIIKHLFIALTNESWPVGKCFSFFRWRHTGRWKATVQTGPHQEIDFLRHLSSSKVTPSMNIAFIFTLSVLFIGECWLAVKCWLAVACTQLEVNTQQHLNTAIVKN